MMIELLGYATLVFLFGSFVVFIAHHETSQEAIRRARRGEGPTLMRARWHKAQGVLALGIDLGWDGPRHDAVVLTLYLGFGALRIAVPWWL